MIALALALSLVSARQPNLAAWTYSLEPMGWTWARFSPDRQTGVFFRHADAAEGVPRLWIRTESFDGQWKSRVDLVEVDCARTRIAVREQTVYSGMNLSGEVRDQPADPAWTRPDDVLAPVMKGACGA